jgi:outer membrane protein
VPLRAPDPLNAEAWVNQSMEQNLDLLVSRIDEGLARDEISSRRNGHLPTIDLVANYGNREVESLQDTGLDVGALPADSNFDSESIGIEFNLPLFAGGVTTSRVREAVYLHRASREVLQRVTRETESTARDSFLAVETDISRVQALRQAVQSSRTALEATEAGFEVGTRTIVQVLDQQFLLYDNIVRYYRARYDYILNFMRLKQAAGTLTVQDLEALEPFLSPRKTPEQQFDEEARALAAGDEPPDLFEGPASAPASTAPEIR